MTCEGMKKSRAPVSVVIPCYCCASTIDRAVESVARQTRLPAEVILIDDGSPDDGETLQALHAVAARYAGVMNVKVIELPENKGPAAVRNAGWDAATQPYIAFLDADDSWLPQKLEIQSGWMKKHPEVAVCGHPCLWPGEDEPKDSREWLEKQESVPYSMISKAYLLLRNAFSTPSVMLKRDVPLRFDDGERYAEDYALWLRAACCSYGIARLDIPLARLHKAPFGEGGLSADLRRMEKGVQDVFRRLHAEGELGLFESMFGRAFSRLKYVRRLWAA